MRRAALLGLTVVAVAQAAAAQPAPAGGPDPARQAAVTGLRINLMRDPRIGGQRAAVLAADWLYCYPPTRELVLVPRDYVTDFASIPRFARHIIEPYGDNAEGAVAHDWFYAVGEPGQRAKADSVLRQGLKEQHVGWLTRNVVWAAVRMFGGRSYGGSREWDQRFGNPQTGAPLPGSPFARRPSAVVGVLDGDCARMDDPVVLRGLYEKYTSAFWPRAGAAP
jgi:hypothetical protein